MSEINKLDSSMNEPIIFMKQNQEKVWKETTKR